MTRAPIEKERLPIESERSVSKSTRSPTQDERVLTKREAWSSVKERTSSVSKPIVTDDERMVIVSKRFLTETEGSSFVSRPMLSPSTRVPIVGERALTGGEHSLSMGTRIFIVSTRLFTGREGFPIVGEGLPIEDMGALGEDVRVLREDMRVLGEDMRVLGEDMRVSSEEVGSFTRGTRVSPVKQRPALAYHGSIMRCERHDLVLAPGGTCVLCRRDAQVAPARRGKRRLVVAAAMALIAIGALFAARRIACEGGTLATASAPASSSGVFAATNAFGRHGSYYLPSGFRGPRAAAVAVALHGTGGSGQAMIDLLRASAEHLQFLVVAPDSGRAPNGQATWQVGDKPNDVTADFRHVRRCVDELLAMPGVRVDPERTLVLGHSGGGSSAPYVATNDPLYKAFAVLHGGAFPRGLGPNRVRGWFSTGEDDPLRPVGSVEKAAGSVSALGLDVSIHAFPGGHGVSPAELDALLRWWLEKEVERSARR